MSRKYVDYKLVEKIKRILPVDSLLRPRIPFDSGKLISVAFGFGFLTLICISAFIYFGRGKRTVYYLATGSHGSSYHKLGMALERVVNSHADEEGLKWRLRVLVSDGSRQNMKLIGNDPNESQDLLGKNGIDKSEKVSFILAQSDTPTNGNCRLVSPLYPEVFHLIASKGINTIDDLKGKRVGVLGVGSRTYDIGVGLLTHYGLEIGAEMDNVHLVPLSADEMVTQFNPQVRSEYFSRELDGHTKDHAAPELDAIFYVIGMGNKLMTNALLRLDSRLIEIPESQALSLWFPKVKPYSIPAGAYGRFQRIDDRGQLLKAMVPDRPIASAQVLSMLCARREVPADVVRTLAEMLHEYDGEIANLDPTIDELETIRKDFGDELKIFNDEPVDWFDAPHAASIVGLFANIDLGIPFHQGTLDYIRQNEPKWIERNADVIALYITLVASLWSGSMATRSYVAWLRRRNAKEYSSILLDIIDDIRLCDDPQVIEAHWLRLTSICQKIVDDIESGRVNREVFQEFRYPWDVAIHMLTHQEGRLGKIINSKVPE